MRRRVAAAAVVVAAALSAPSAHALDICAGHASAPGGGTCVTLLDGSEYVCDRAWVDPSAQTVDDVVSAGVCLVDRGDGPTLVVCAWAGRRELVCTE